MSEIKELLNKIEMLRKDLENLISLSENNLIDPKIVKVSKKLDEVLNEYDRLIKASIDGTYSDS